MATKSVKIGQFAHFMGSRAFGQPIELQFPTDLTKHKDLRVVVYAVGDPFTIEKTYDRQGIEKAKFKIGEHGPETATVTFTSDPGLAYGQRITIHLNGDRQPWYSGYAKSPSSAALHDGPWVEKFDGYFKELNSIIVGEPTADDFTNMEVTDIVKDIFTDYIGPKTPIEWAEGRIVEVGYDVASVSFDRTTGKKCLERLAEIAQNYRWGVDANLKLFFMPIEHGSYRQLYWTEGHEFLAGSVKEDWANLINKVFVKAGSVQTEGAASTNFIASASVATSYPTREKVKSAPEIFDADDATRWASNILDYYSEPITAANLKDVDIYGTGRIPLFGKIAFFDRAGNTENLIIKNVSYTISPDNYTAVVDLGAEPESYSTDILDLIRQDEDDGALTQANLNA